MLAPIAVAMLAGACNAEASRPYSNYTLEELQSFSILERVTRYDWKLEAFTISFTLLFVGLWYLGTRYNKLLVTLWLDAHRELLSSQFHQFGVHPLMEYACDDPENYSSYATGRTNVGAVNIQFKLKPRNNFFVYFLETVLSYFFESIHTPEDRVELKLSPNVDVEAFIWAVVSKNGLNDHRAKNYYLSLTRTAESSDLPVEYVYMTESPEFNGLAKGLVLVLPKVKGFLKYVAITDQSQERPTILQDLISKPRIVVSMAIPRKAELAASVEFVRAVLDLADTWVASKFRAEVLKKVVKTRDVEVSKILKYQEDLKNEELAEQRLKEKREARDELKKLSPAEQAKHEEREKKKEEKKMKKKQRKQKV